MIGGDSKLDSRVDVITRLRAEKPVPPSGAEVSALAAIAVGFLVLNLLTSARSPTVWLDETAYSDPAVNLLLGNGFTTTAWRYQPKEEFFAGNTPLHPSMLFLWMTVFGFSVEGVRSFNYVLILVVTAGIWYGVRRLKLISLPWFRILLVLLILCGDGVTCSYRSARPDCIGMVVVAGLLVGFLLERPRRRFAMLVTCSALVPLAGVQLMPYVVLLCLLTLLVLGTSAAKEICAVAAGGILGSACLYALLSANGVWPQFVSAIVHASHVDDPIKARMMQAWKGLHIDYSKCVITCFLMLAMLVRVFRGRVQFRSPVVIGLFFAVVVPVTIGLVGKFPRYYAWTAFIPMSICAIMVVQQSWNRTRPFAFLLPVVAVACLVGLPARLTLTALEWDARDYAPVEEFVERHVNSNDCVYCEPAAYYPAKRKAATVFLPSYKSVMSPEEKAEVTLLIVSADSFQAVGSFLGGQWERIEAYSSVEGGISRPFRRNLGARLYDLAVYRRVP